VTMQVVSVSARAEHGLGKTVQVEIELIAGQGVSGDVHCGPLVKHRSRVAKDASQPNLRQVHLVNSELLVALAAKGFDVRPGDLGENILTRGLDLLALSTGTILSIGNAKLQITGLRNPCAQLNGHSEGLMHALLERCRDGRLIRKGGIMAIVTRGGHVARGDAIHIDYVPEPADALKPV
jgi:MOSC domain-containing protein YiiM